MRATVSAIVVLLDLVLGTRATLAACLPPPPGLAAWWRFEDNLVDSVGTADMSIVPASAPYGPGKVLRGIDFGACVGLCAIEAPNPFDFSTASFSVDVWVKAEPTWPSQGVAWLLDKRDLSTSEQVGFSVTLRPYAPTGNYVQLQLRAVGGALTSWDWYYGPLFDGGWHLLTVTLERGPDQARARLFIDDQEMAYVSAGATRTFNGDIDNGTPIRVGRLVCATSCGGILPGDIDELEIFDRVLQPSDVQAIYAADRDGKCFCGDHLKCYKIRDSQKFVGQVDLESRFGVEAGCQLRAPAVEYCVPAMKTVVSAPATFPIVGDCVTQEQLCYRLRCNPPVPQPTAVQDQFGDHVVTPRKAVQLCTPIPRPTLTTTSTSSSSTSSTSSSTQTTCTCPVETTTTTTTTLPPPWPPCADPSVTSPLCDGACPPGMMCVDLGVGTCTCAPAGGQDCGAALGPPQCWGDCPLDPDTNLEQTCKQAFQCSVSLDKCRPVVVPCPLPEDSCDPICRCFPPEPVD